MSRTNIFSQFARLLNLGLDPIESEFIESRTKYPKLDRRQFLKEAGTIGAIGAASVFPTTSFAGELSADVGIVGAGLAGLVCADELRKNAIHATVYESASRLGGRCYSLRGFFPGQTAERGGEFIDNLHKVMLGYANEFGLRREDVTRFRGEVSYFFGRQHHSEREVVAAFRDFVPRMREDLRKLSQAPTADAFTTADAQLDATSLSEYLVSRGADALTKAVIEEAYEAEYGLAASQQSCLNLLLFIHADRRSKFTPFGVFSDERWHLPEGNDAIVQGIAARIRNPIQIGMQLVRIDRTAHGKVELTFLQGTRTEIRSHEIVVLTIPFTTLRKVEWGRGLSLPSWKRLAIDSVGYGTNAKTVVGFAGRPWASAGSNGSSYSDLTNHQTTWETNPGSARPDRAVLTDYSSGARGAGLEQSRLQEQVLLFLGDLDRVYPGSLNAASRDQNGNWLAHLEHWPSNPNSLGSYTCYRPGQFTSIAGNEGKPVENVFFAGEHTNSFYEWQGFMEGAALSGVKAARDIVLRVRGKT